jgi:hypothetical protein|uniref:Lipoprotein n=1 Tax=candidate division WOR-3 bacterium TaxID=2052148 RepID=A0A7V3NVE7_UNCW3
MKTLKNLIPFLVTIFASCGAIKLTYDYKSRSLTWPRSYNLRIYVGEFKETSDSVFGEMELIGTEHNLKNVFVIEPRDFLRRAFIKEIQNSNLFPLARNEEEADIVLQGTLDKFYVNFKIHKIPQQPNGLEYKFNTEGWIKATMYVYQKGQLIYKINAKSEIKDKGEMFLFGHWEDVVRDELDRMLQPMIFAVMDSVETFVSRR